MGGGALSGSKDLSHAPDTTPILVQMIVFYFFSPRMLRSIAYGSKPRNRLDVYVPRKKWRRAGAMPTVIFITGGAWTIGYKGGAGLAGSSGPASKHVHAMHEHWTSGLPGPKPGGACRLPQCMHP